MCLACGAAELANHLCVLRFTQRTGYDGVFGKQNAFIHLVDRRRDSIGFKFAFSFL